MTLKFLQVVTQLEAAGAQSMAAWLENKMSPELNLKTIFLYNKSGSDLFDSDRCIMPVRPSTVPKALTMLRLFRRQILLHRGGVVVHTHYAAAIVVLVLLSIRTRPPVIIVHHWPEDKYPRSSRVLIQIGRALRIFKREIYVSPSVTSSPNDCVIPNPVVLSTLPVSDTDYPHTEELQPNPDILVVARHSAEKSIETVIRAMKYLPDRRLTLVGQGPNTHTLTELVAMLELNDRVKFLGRLENARTRYYMRNSSVLVLASLWEAMPMVLLEGVAEGANLVVSNIPGHEFVTQVGAALSFEVRNPSMLAQVIDSLEDAPVVAALAVGREKLLDVQSEESVANLWRAQLSSMDSVAR